MHFLQHAYGFWGQEIQWYTFHGRLRDALSHARTFLHYLTATYQIWTIWCLLHCFLGLCIHWYTLYGRACNARAHKQFLLFYIVFHWISAILVTNVGYLCSINLMLHILQMYSYMYKHFRIFLLISIRIDWFLCPMYELWDQGISWCTFCRRHRDGRKNCFKVKRR